MERSVVTYRFLSLFILIVTLMEPIYGDNMLEDNAPEYATFKLFVGRTDVGSVRTICIGDSVFVHLADVVGRLGFPYQWDADKQHFSTHCPTSTRYIGIKQDSLSRNDSCWLLAPSEIKYDEESLYLLSTRFREVCSFEIEVIFESLRLKISSTLLFPRMILHRQQQMREEAFSERDALLFEHVDTLPLSHGRLSSIGYNLSAATTSTRQNAISGRVGASGEFLKGSLNLNYSHSGGSAYRNNLLTFNLDYAIKKEHLKQVNLFRNYSSFNMNLGGYANGIYLSNDNSTFFNQRYYLYKEQVRPNANVEIYNNRTLVSYLTSDSLGRFTVKIPVTTGANVIRTVTINLYGESATDETTIYIPVNLEAKGRFKYALTTGYTDAERLFTGVYLTYGITDFLTATALTESIIDRGKVTAIGGAGLRLGFKQWFQLSGEYLPTVRYNFSLVGNVSNYLGYSFFHEQYRRNQDKILYAPISKSTLSITGSLPIQRSVNTLTLSMRRTEYRSGTQYNSSLNYKFKTKVFTASAFVQNHSQHSFLPDRLTLGGQLGYKISKRLYDDLSYKYIGYFNENQIRNRLQLRIDQRLSANMEVEYQVRNRNLSFQIGFSYRLPWITLASNFQTSNRYWSMNNGVSGGIDFYGKGGYHLSPQNVPGATLCVILFLDANGNGKHDKGEEIILNPKVKIGAATEATVGKNGTFFKNIPPNNAFRITVPQQVFRDITWQITPVDTAYCLAPYQLHTVRFAVKVISEISGEVYKKVNGRKYPQRNVLLVITDEQGKTERVRTDNWGIYEYNGLIVGNYKIALYSPKLKAKGDKERKISVPASKEGGQIEGIDFELVED